MHLLVSHQYQIKFLFKSVIRKLKWKWNDLWHFDLEGDAKKMTQMFFFIVFSIFLIMVSCVYILKVDTLTIPKW